MVNWGRRSVEPGRFEVRRWAPAWPAAVAILIAGLAVGEALDGRWPMGAVWVALAALWAVPLGVAQRTSADADGLELWGRPWPWSATRLPWSEVADVVATTTEVRVVPADGGRPFEAVGCREVSLSRRRRERRLLLTCRGLLAQRPDPSGRAASPESPSPWPDRR